jgi:hypothetical protein
MHVRQRLLGLVIILLLTVLAPLEAQAPAPGSILTVAGGEPNNVSALSLSLEAQSVAADSAGNTYTTSPDLSVVFKVTPSGQASVYAGNGAFGYGGDSGPATNAALGCPAGIALDAANDLFIADFCDDVVREVIATTGIIQTIAGNGTAGYSGDGSSATSAQLNGPIGVSVDAAGNTLFIADTSNNVIREVFGGTIETAAGTGTAGFTGDGGPATSAELSSPFGVFEDSLGNVFVADSGNSVIRELVCETGAGGCTPPAGETSGDIYAVAGNGIPGFTGDGGLATSAELNGPEGVAVDGFGNVFVADSGNNVIREVSKGVIHTMAGNGAAGFSGDAGPATSAELNFPSGIAVDNSANVLIGDFQNSRVRKVSAGTINTLAGNGFPSYSGDGGSATHAQFGFPIGFGVGVAADNDGNFIIADSGDNVVREVKVSTGDIATVAGNGTSGYAGDSGPATIASLNGPRGVAVDTSGDIFIADSLNNVVREVIAASGDIITIAGNGVAAFSGDGGLATSATLNQPFGVAVDNAGDLFISDTNNNVIREVVCATGASGCSPPAGKTTGDIYTIAGNGTPGNSGDGGPATSAQLTSPDGLCFDPAGDLLIADSGNNEVRMISGGTISTMAGNGTAGYAGDNGPAAGANLNQPAGVAADIAGNVFISDTNNNAIREVVCGLGVAACSPPAGKTSGDIYTVAGNGTAAFSGDGGPASSAELGSPRKLALDGSGNLLFPDFDANRIREIAGIATAATVNFSAPSLMFTPAQVLTSSPASQVVTVTPGSYPVTITNIAISGDSDFTQKNNCGALPVTLQPGTAGCGITVTFHAASDGPRSATLAVTDTAANSPQDIPLSGAGIDFSLGAAPGGSTSATVSPGQTASYSLQISAVGGFAATDQLSVSIASCTGAPTGATCNFPSSPVTATPSAPGAFTITVPVPKSAILPLRIRPDFPRVEILAVGLAALVFIFFLLRNEEQRRVPLLASSQKNLLVTLALFSLLAFSTLALAGCGTSAPGQRTYMLNVQGMASGVSHSVQLTLNVK